MAMITTPTSAGSFFDQGPGHDFAFSVVEGLSARPRKLECRFLYDARGSALYNEITRQPEYYLTRTEAGILEHAAADIASLTAGSAIVELGSGDSAKTSHVLSAASACGPVCYYPVDVSRSALDLAERRIQSQHDGVVVWPLCKTYEEALPLLPSLSPVLLLFLGSTIGNFDEAETDDFLSSVSSLLSPGDFFLLGLDLVKEPLLLERAYNDAAGITAQFTLNIFARMNRELAAGLDLTAIRHVARYVSARSRIEIFGRFTKRQVVRVPLLGREFVVEAGEEILVEISRKFSLPEIVPYLESFGFAVRQTFLDPRRWFSVLLLQRLSRAHRHLQ